MKLLLCIVLLFIAMDVCASEEVHSYTAHTTRLQSGAIKRKDMSEQKLFDAELQDDDDDEDYPAPTESQQKKFKPTPPTPPLTATTTTQEPSQMDLLQEHLKTKPVHAITLTQRIEALEKQHEYDKKQQAELAEALKKIILPIQSALPSIHETLKEHQAALDSQAKRLDETTEILQKHTSYLAEHVACLNSHASCIEHLNKREPVSLTSPDYQTFRYEDSADMILDFGLGEIA